MNRLIQRHNTHAFIDKIKLEWPGFIEAARHMNERLVFIQLLEKADAYAFTSSLMPKLGALVDFSHPLEIFILNNDGVSLEHLRFNCETISVSA
ncbi:hypothetical protein QWY86_12840 [Pedobacter aquatilis]|uniref:hypothetical protein n=1 Tax=Pedobacter aquatilis TaxID=351343 RepID=UPI0025B4BEC5|nr:hypothetical protein [Pedobacter aquatilis]MDN3587561.1 hypothetical protein [Pedobacter aquatilis]